MRQRQLTIAGSVFGIGAIFTAGGMAAAVPVHATEIIYGTYNAPTAPLSKDGLLPWLEELKRLSNGEITYQFKGGCPLLRQKTAQSSIRVYIASHALIVDANYPAQHTDSTEKRRVWAKSVD